MIYVLHFERPYHHARHYVGYAERDVARRVHEHLTSTGRRPSPLVRAVVAAGIEVTLAAIIVGDRALERRIKDHAHAAAHCPLCREGYLARARERMRALRARRRETAP